MSDGSHIFSGAVTRACWTVQHKPRMEWIHITSTHLLSFTSRTISHRIMYTLFVLCSIISQQLSAARQHQHVHLTKPGSVHIDIYFRYVC